ncbi:MAG: gamma carbonic anhydrase family protein [Sphaerochaeta sp.]|nr:gamma carbonic anhydrase family protein [Sphaerochaeta sp.]
MILNFKDKQPHIEASCFIAPSADIIGEVVVGKASSVWFNTTVRGDVASIHIGEGTNIQDNTVVHVSTNVPVSIGDYVTIGHGVIIHSCTIGDGCLIGMGSTILDGAVLAEETLVGAASLIPPGKTYPPRSLVMGSPAKFIRILTEEELREMKENTRHYVQASSVYKTNLS